MCLHKGLYEGLELPLIGSIIFIPGNDRLARGQLLEEYLQIGGDWKQSAIVANATAFETNRRRGVYKYMSREECSFLLYT